MKKCKQISLVIFCIVLMMGCSKEDGLLKNDTTLKSTEFGANNEGETLMVTVPFKANFTVWHYEPDEPWCDNDHVSELKKGSGTISHLGKISTTMTFCVIPTPPPVEYYDTNIVFVAANGDELYASIPIGYILLNEEDNAAYYTVRFNDKMYFTGGTGRFEGAAGEAMTHAYVHLPTDEWRHKGDEIWHTDFFSTGELILQKKGKKQNYLKWGIDWPIIYNWKDETEYYENNVDTVNWYCSGYYHGKLMNLSALILIIREEIIELKK